MLTLRPASADDAPLVLALIGELATYERLAHEAVASLDDINAALFCGQPRVFCEIAEWNGAPAGFALWFYNFSTFAGRHGIYLEDLYVRPEHRGRGLGRALLGALARRCQSEGLARLEWAVLDWNAPSIAFYERMGAQPMNDWTVYRLTGEPLAELAGATGS